MADLRVSQRFALTLSSDEMRLLSKALRGELTPEELPAAMEMQEAIMLSRAAQSDQIAKLAAKTATNIERAKASK